MRKGEHENKDRYCAGKALLYWGERAGIKHAQQQTAAESKVQIELDGERSSEGTRGLHPLPEWEPLPPFRTIEIWG